MYYTNLCNRSRVPLPSVQDKGELSLIGLTVEELSRNANEARANPEKVARSVSEAREIFCLNFEGTSRRSPHEQRANNEKVVIEAVTKRREMYKIMHIEVEPKSRKSRLNSERTPRKCHHRTKDEQKEIITKPRRSRENSLNEQKEIAL